MPPKSQSKTASPSSATGTSRRAIRSKSRYLAFNSFPQTSTTRTTDTIRMTPEPKTPSSIEPQIEIAKTSPKIEGVAEKASSAPPETAVENVPVTESGGGTGEVTKTPAKTVVKKRVRIVKKIVKRKVPKSVQKGLVQESEEKHGENPNSGALEVVNANPNQSVLKEVQDGNIDSNPRLDVSVSTDAENPNFNQSVSLEVENPEEPAVCNEEEMDASMTEVSISNSVEAMKNDNGAEIADSSTKTQLDEENVDLIQNQNYDCESENVDCGGVEENEGVKEEGENCEIGGSKGEVGTGNEVLMSGEMEALERKRRRKTEIFVGGLDKDTEEEDVRKVFEEVGEIVEVRVMLKGKKGKNGFAFVRFASAADAKNALAKYPRVEIRGKQCSAAFVEGNDTIFLGNLDKKWKSEDVLKLLQEIGIEKIDKVTVKADPTNIECSRGFAFLELETKKDAQNAYKKLQSKDVFGTHGKIKVAWAEPLKEPDEEEMLKVKSVYAEYIPSSWDEEKVTDYFKKFGDIENVALARNLYSSKRKDFAFVNYTTREAALTCIEAFNRGSLHDEGSKVKVSLAKSIPKGKQIKQFSIPISKESSVLKRKAAQPVIKPHEPRYEGKVSSSYNADVALYRDPTSAELVQLLREQASWKQPRTGLGMSSLDLDYSCSSPGRKRPFTSVVDDPFHSDSRSNPRRRLESSYPVASPSGLSQGADVTVLPYYHRQGAGYGSGSLYGVEDYPDSLLIRGARPYLGSSGSYRRY